MRKLYSFKQQVLQVVKRIPKGKVMTYKQVAWMAGSPLAFRAVGNIMANNNDPKVPCHRVIRSDGKVGGYRGSRQGTKEKEKRLKREKALI